MRKKALKRFGCTKHTTSWMKIIYHWESWDSISIKFVTRLSINLTLQKLYAWTKKKLYKQTLFKMSSRGVRIHIAIFMSDTHRKLSWKCVKRRCSAFIPHFYVFWKGVMTLLFMFLCILEMCNYSFLIGVYVPFSALLRLLAHFQLYIYIEDTNRLL